MVESFLDGKNSLKDGIPAFNKDTAVEFKELAPEEKSRYGELATVEEGNELSEKQVSNKVSNIFTKLRDHTVSNIHS
jgi:hypothetical protein